MSTTVHPHRRLPALHILARSTSHALSFSPSPSILLSTRVSSILHSLIPLSLSLHIYMSMCTYIIYTYIYIYVYVSPHLSLPLSSSLFSPLALSPSRSLSLPLSVFLCLCLSLSLSLSLPRYPLFQVCGGVRVLRYCPRLAVLPASCGLARIDVPCSRRPTDERPLQTHMTTEHRRKHITNTLATTHQQRCQHK